MVSQLTPPSPAPAPLAPAPQAPASPTPAGRDDDARRFRLPLEAFALLVVTFCLAVGLHLPPLWFLMPFALLTVTKRSYADYGLNLQQLGGVRFHAAVIGAVFVPYIFGHYLWAHWSTGAAFRLRWPPGLLSISIDQLLLIALPEEVFFRGYLQTQFDRAWGQPFRFLGTAWGVGLPLAAALFAVCHVFFGGPIRLTVFFPGLLYGWLRARSGNVVVPAFYHAGSNVLMQVMLASLSG